MGRPTSYNEQRADAIIAAVERLGFAHIAAELNGIHRTTLTAWLERAENGEEPFATFAERYRKARATWQEKKVGEVRDAKWELERAEPGIFRQQAAVELSGNIALELAELEGQSSQQLKSLIREVLSEGEQTDAKTEHDV